MGKKTYVWNSKKGCLEEFRPPPDWYIPITHDPDLFKKGLCRIREEFGNGGKRKGFRISPEKRRK